MAIKRTITKELNIQTICNTANSFTICRGDSVDFLFTFKNGAEDFDISTATTARIFAKKIKYDGVNILETPLFSKEVNLSENLSSMYEGDVVKIYQILQNICFVQCILEFSVIIFLLHYQPE